MRGISAVSLVAAGVILVVSLAVGERAPSPSPVVTATARADSEAAPARSLADGNGEDGVGELADPPSSGVIPDDGASVRAGSSPAPASTVTQSALKEEGGAGITRDPFPVTMPSRPTVTVSPTDGGALTPSASYTVIDPAPAIPPAQRVPVGSYEPWPAYLWPVVECLIQRESGGLEWKVSPGGDVGLMQIGPANFVWLAERGITRAMLFDGPANIRAGWLLYVWWEGVNGDGLTPWKSTRGGCA